MCSQKAGVATVLCLALLLSGCLPRSQAVVKREAAEAASALGLTPAQLLLATDNPTLTTTWYVEWYQITTTVVITDVDTQLKSVGYTSMGYGPGNSFGELDRLSDKRFVTLGVNPSATFTSGARSIWLKSRSRTVSNSIDLYDLSQQSNFYNFDGKLLTGWLIRIKVDYP